MPHIHFMYRFQLDLYDAGIRFRDGVRSMWERPGDDSLLDECKDFLKILDPDHDNE